MRVPIGIDSILRPPSRPWLRCAPKNACMSDFVGLPSTPPNYPVPRRSSSSSPPPRRCSGVLKTPQAKQGSNCSHPLSEKAISTCSPWQTTRSGSCG